MPIQRGVAQLAQLELHQQLQVALDGLPEPEGAHPRRGRALARLGAAFLAAVVAGMFGDEPAAAQQPPPNVVVVMTDDQTEESMRVMPRVRRLLGGEGTRFVNSFVNFPVCCPSRATYLTGQYAHNHGVLWNFHPEGGFEKFFAAHGANILPGWLQSGGYFTAHVGKYLNEYGAAEPTLVPGGWNEWYGAVEHSSQRVVDYSLNENGVLVKYGDQPEDFKGDVITRRAVDLIERRAPAPQPFFLSVAYTAPHNGAPNQNGDPCLNTAKPAPRHLGAFADEPLPTPPSLNELDTSDKPSEVAYRWLRTPEQIVNIERRYRCELESLLHVDEGVRDIVEALRGTGELDETLVVFTSDNGFFHGEHRIGWGKYFPYEESSRVPLFIRGPGIPVALKVRDLVTNADLAPTILDAAGVQPGLLQDGRSLLEPPPQSTRELLIESPLITPTYAAIRTSRYMYAEYESGDRELYDLHVDPYQLDSLHGDPAYGEAMAWLAQRLDELRACAGATCVASAGEPPPPDTDPPQTRIASGPPEGATITSGNASFEFTSDEPGSRFECSLDGEPLSACTSPHTIQLLSEGEHVFDVRAIDPAGNADPTPASRRFSFQSPDQGGGDNEGGGPAGAGGQGTNTRRCGGERATIVGTADADYLLGTARRDVIAARSGRDKVRGRGGNDLICGGRGGDQLSGGKGSDDLRGGRGADTCKGGRGDGSMRGCESARWYPLHGIRAPA